MRVLRCSPQSTGLLLAAVLLVACIGAAAGMPRQLSQTPGGPNPNCPSAAAQTCRATKQGAVTPPCLEGECPAYTDFQSCFAAYLAFCDALNGLYGSPCKGQLSCSCLCRLCSPEVPHGQCMQLCVAGGPGAIPCGR